MEEYQVQYLMHLVEQQIIAANGKRGYAFTANSSPQLTAANKSGRIYHCRRRRRYGVACGGGGHNGGVMTNIPGIIPGPATGDVTINGSLIQ